MSLLHALSENVKNFGTSTTAHGIPHATESHGFRRCLWLMVLCCCLGGFIFQAVLLMEKFFKRDIIVNIEMKFDRIMFPAVTICNLNPYKNSLVGSISSLKDTMRAFESAMNHYNKDKNSPRSRIKRANISDEFSNVVDFIHTNCKQIKDSYVIDPNGNKDCVCLNHYSTFWNCRPRSEWKYSYCKCDDQKTICQRTKHSLNLDIRNSQKRMQCICSEDICFGTDNAYNDCIYPLDDGGKISCICTPVIKMCVRVYRNEELTLTGIFDGNFSLSENYTTSLPRIKETIPRIWDIFKVKSPEEAEEVREEEEKKEKAYGLKGMNDVMAIRAKTSENIVFAMNNLDDSDKSSISHVKEEFIKKCSFNGRDCSIEDDFVSYIDPSYGTCFTFRKNSTDAIIERTGRTYGMLDIIAQKSIQNSGLRLQLFVDIDEYLPTTDIAGARVVVHDQYEQPFPDSDGYNAPVGVASALGMRMKRLQRLPHPYGDCIVDGRDEDYIYKDKKYSIQGCLRSCVQKYLVMQCTCGDPRFPKYRDYDNCPVDDPDLRECLEKEVKYTAQNADKLGCVCKQPCKQDIYVASYSAALWPAGPKALTDCPSGMDSKECLAYFREEYALIEVFYESLNYERFSEGEAYGMPNLLSDFGGQLGLWMGVSVITIIEVALLIIDLFFAVTRFFSEIGAKMGKGKPNGMNL
ncbi:unnamed protein product [Dracunculus medinensis]|uniref:Degenerin-like protein unc-105 (inferred by orthology to a C. elegans protein) n=1 Tax=Dracunculus medinensis TaxID=318479 RepID=A0A158Q3X1_DRAME|nr:unnamed protein product [Dracunculus medinensis]